MKINAPLANANVVRLTEVRMRPVPFLGVMSLALFLVQAVYMLPLQVWARLIGPALKNYIANNLTIINIEWRLDMAIMPHNHKMPPVIDVYTDSEANIFWRRTVD